ncbi:conserved Plasmodium protein, unknown function [Plasmodium malariae]|uniref:Uncharacterized protein n=1 Tax=Plasmodium malariae TaxID=5858 RepID=A0A1A8X5C4_PLAMA|nr:conserved Plasmodium protein, unknown function [Plasmodium malariae]
MRPMQNVHAKVHIHMSRSISRSVSRSVSRSISRSISRSVSRSISRRKNFFYYEYRSFWIISDISQNSEVPCIIGFSYNIRYHSSFLLSSSFTRFDSYDVFD